MASFDIGTGFGARIMMFLGGRRVALFTGEGAVTCKAGRIALGPLALSEDGRELLLTFKGPAVVVPDSSAYLSIERALASGRLDGAAEVSARLKFPGSRINLDEITSGAGARDAERAGLLRKTHRDRLGRRHDQPDRCGRARGSFIHWARAAKVRRAPDDMGVLTGRRVTVGARAAGR